MIRWNGRELPTTRGGLVGEFGRLYVFTGEIDRDVGRELSRALMKRNQARYDPRANIGSSDADAVIALAEKIIKLAKTRIAGNRKHIKA